jgi:hypothetical protein
MNKFFCLFSLLSIIFTVSASEEWLYYKAYPWVWDNKTEDWLYLRGGEDGKIYAYRNSTKVWEEFNVQKEEKTWDKQYLEWVKNPEPYGGLDVLQKIKQARDNSLKQLELEYYKSYPDPLNLLPLTGLNRLKKIRFGSGPGFFVELDFGLIQNHITHNLEVLSVWFCSIEDFKSITNLTFLKDLDLTNCYISELGPLSDLKELKYLKLESNEIVDLSPLSGLENLEELHLGANPRIQDLSPLKKLVNLKHLHLGVDPDTGKPEFSTLQKEDLQRALPNTNIYWNYGTWAPENKFL